MPYKPKEKEQLKELLFRAKGLKKFVREFLGAQSMQDPFVLLDNFKKFLYTDLQNKVENPACKLLLTKARVDGDPDFIRFLLEKLTGIKFPQPVVAVKRPPPLPPDCPGFPLDQQYAAQAADALRLEHEDVKKALQPTQFSGSMIYVSGYPHPLCHQTCKSRVGNGVPNSRGKDVVTFFYAWYKGAAYLVAWGHHVDERGREVGYRVDGAVEGAKILRGVLLTFGSPTAEPSFQSAPAKCSRSADGWGKEEKPPWEMSRPPKRYQTDPEEDDDEDDRTSPQPGPPKRPPKGPPKKRK